jgi:uncharacterized alpha/beta hydrolase family protein
MTTKRKKIRLKWYRTFPFHIMIILLISTLPFLILMRINFFLEEQLMISIDPIDSYKKTYNNMNNSLTIKTSIQNYPLCTAICNITLIDLNKGIIENQEKNKIINGRETKSHIIEYKTLEKGAGILLKRFEISCINKASILCPADENKRTAQTFITIAYDLHPEEQKLKTEFLDNSKQIIDFLNITINTQEKIKKISKSLKRFENFQDVHSILEKKESYDKQIKFHEQRFKNLIIIFNNESYKELSIFNYSNVERQLEIIYINQNKTIQESINFIITYNSILNDLESINLSKMHEIYHAYTILSDTNRSFILSLVRITEIIQELNKISIEISKEKEIDFEETRRFLEQINEEEQIFINITNRLIKETISIELENTTIKYRNKDTNFSSFDELCNFLENNSEIILPKFQNNTQDISINNSANKTLSPLINRSNDISGTNITNQINISLTKMQIKKAKNNICTIANITTKRPTFFNITTKQEQIIIPNLNINKDIYYDIDNKTKRCCFYNYCEPFCNDCKEPYPTLFIHGHQFSEKNSPEYSLNAFTDLLQNLEKKGFIYTGQLNLDSTGKKEWSDFPRPIVTSASFLYITYIDVGIQVIQIQKNERIENYAIRLSEIIDTLKKKTGKEKVNIVAHSMGGLVARQYISLFGQEDIDKLIMIGTPNKGIIGKVKDLCKITGADDQCDDMSEGSIFLKRLNSKEIDKVKLYTISGTGCKMDTTTGDGVVTLNNSFFEEAEKYIIEGNCTDAFGTNLHGDLLKPDKYPKVVNIIQEILLS